MITVIGSLKGGSGKSTLTFNLAVWLAMAGIKVRVHDVDPQATLSDVADVRAEEKYAPNIDVQGLDGLNKLRKGSGKANGTEILVDIGTADMDAMKKAISVADRIVVPVPPSQADIWSTQRFLGFVGSVNGSRKKPEVMGFVNRADTHHAIRESDEAAAALVALPGIRFVKSRLAQRTVFRRSFSEGLAVFELEPRGKGAKEFTSLAAVLYPEILK